MDFVGGNIGSMLEGKTLNECFDKCGSTPNCKGVVSDFSLGNGPGNCWLKSDMTVPKPDTSKFPFFYSKYPPLVLYSPTLFEILGRTIKIITTYE